jgi:hypothetical protein
MPLYVRFAILGTCFVFLLCSLVIEIRIIAEIYRENEQYGGKTRSTKLFSSERVE